MKTTLSIKINLLNGEVMTFKENAAIHFEFQQWGTLFVEGAMEVKTKQRGLIVDEVEYRNVRNWIPISNIKNVEIITWKRINDPEEIRKWQKFKEHGFDLMITPVSHTAPKTKEEVEKEIEEEEKVREKN